MKLLLLAVLMTPLLFVGQAQAHVLKTDGSIGAVLHVKPDDNPQSGMPTNYALTFRDTESRFKVSGCDCRVTLRSGDKILTTQSLRSDTDVVGTGTLTFPESGAYELVVNGQAKDSADFNNFTLSYTLRAGGEAGASRQEQTIPPLLWVGMAGFIVLVLLSATRLDRV
jgi:hypothetical protein